MLILETLEVDEMVQFAAEQGVDIVEIIRLSISGELSAAESAERLAERAKKAIGSEWQKLCMLLLMPPITVGLVKLTTANAGGIRNTASLICRVSCISSLADAFISMRSTAEELLEVIAKCTDVLSPVLVAAATLSGAETAALFLTPMTGVCVNLIQRVLIKWGVTIGSAAAAIALSGNLCSSIRLDRLYGLCRKIIQIGAGGTLAVFALMLSMQGRINTSRDGMAFRTARFAVENFVPIVGGNISDSLDSLLSTVHIVKEALGIGACVLIMFICLAPMIRLLAASLILQFSAAVAEPLGDRSMTDMLEQLGGAVEMLLVVTITAVVLCGLLTGSCLAATSNVIH